LYIYYVKMKLLGLMELLSLLMEVSTLANRVYPISKY
jgi:hypothetical protein